MEALATKELALSSLKDNGSTSKWRRLRAEVLRRDCTLELREKDIQIDQLNIKLDREDNRKRNWRRIALIEGGVITAIILILVL